MNEQSRHWALIVNGLVHDVTNTSPVGRFAPALVWVECTTNPPVQAGWAFDGTNFSAPPAPTAPAVPVPPTLAQLQAELADLTAKIAALTPQA